MVPQKFKKRKKKEKKNRRKYCKNLLIPTFFVDEIKIDESFSDFGSN